jgi:hypothetical protein
MINKMFFSILKLQFYFTVSLGANMLNVILWNVMAPNEVLISTINCT